MKNGKSKNAAPKGEFNVTDIPMDANAYKTFDISKAVKQDVQAAVSLLSLILDNPQILDIVVGEIEKIRSKIIEQESMPKREDFHPEMTPNS